MAKNQDILGIDVGGNNIKFGLVNQRARLMSYGQIPTPTTAPAIINALIKIIGGYERQIKAVGLGLPGLLDLSKGLILKTPNLPFHRTPIVSRLHQKVKKPIKIENDANCFVLAESVVGGGKNYKYVAGFTLGTGVGGGLVINKKIYHGQNQAGEFGHQVIDFHQGQKLETLLGARALKLSAAALIGLEKQAQAQNPLALKFWRNYGTALGFACVNIIKILDPEIIILGGKQARAFKYFRPQVAGIVRQHCPIRPAKIVKSQLIDKAGIIGAALLFKQQF